MPANLGGDDDRMPRKTNVYFTRPCTYPVFAPARSAFDHLVEQLGLTPEQYETSGILREWVERYKDERYVPPELLAIWGLTVKA
jgi:hypothetical protein